MGKVIVNKHYDESSDITREKFHLNDEIAKGEIIILNSETPSIYVLNKEGLPKKIDGGGNSAGGSECDIESIKSEVKDELRNEFSETYNGIINDIENIRSDIEPIQSQISTINENYQDADTQLYQKIDSDKENILSHTINEKPIKDNPILCASDIKVGDYFSIDIENEAEENVVNNDTTQKAIKKIENMTIANALAFAAAINDIDKRVYSYEIKEEAMEGDVLHLKNNIFHVIANPVNVLKFEFDEEVSSVKEYIVMLTTGDNISITFPTNIVYTTKPFNSLKANTTYIVKIRYNYVDIIELYII